MATLRVERVPIQLFRLGWIGGDHMHLALQQDEANPNQDGWWVLEGTRGTGADGVLRLGSLGEDGITTLSQANGNATGAALENEIGTPAYRGSRIVDVGGDALAAWLEMAAAAEDIEDQRYPYVALGNVLSISTALNSSSFVATLLYQIGVNIEDVLPTTLRFAPGWKTLLGSSNNDELTLEWSFNSIFAGRGNDTLKGTDANLLPEKLFGGAGDDLFLSTTGVNYYHGGELSMSYTEDGTDTVFYQNIGVVTITANEEAVENVTPEFYIFSTGGHDQFFSIERVRYGVESDTLIFAPNVGRVPVPLQLDLGDQSSLDQGDTLDFSALESLLTVGVDEAGFLVVQTEADEGTNNGFWIENAEWLTASSADDAIYTSTSLRGVEGGGGNDLIDVRLAERFTGASERGYDVEVFGGEGDDTIVASAGSTILNGGAGSDRFVLSEVTPPGAQRVEVVIEDAEAADRLFIPYDLFNLDYSDFEGSNLFPLLGAMAQFSGASSFNDLPQDLGPWNGGPQSRNDFFAFEWQLQADRWFGSNQLDGVIEFTGAILYNRDGADLLIHVFLGDPEEITELANNDDLWTHTINIFYPESEALIRVRDFQAGDLGIQFYDPGQPQAIDVDTDHGTYSAFDYPNWDAAVRAMTNNGVMQGPLETRPVAPSWSPDEQTEGEEPPVEEGTEGDDVIAATGGSTHIAGLGGNDSLSGALGNDVLDGGAGADQMAGGAGNDVYIVDDAGDSITELSGQGTDRVIASTSFVLGANVEHLELSAGAVNATGSGGDNLIQGNAAANTILGLGGRDTLFGNGGNDLLDGGEGSDSYVYTAGGGDDVIHDTGTGASDSDLLVLEDFLPEDVSLFRLTSSPGDLFIGLPDGSRIRIVDFEDVSGGGIERIRFAQGNQWSTAELDAAAAAAPLLENDAPTARDDYDFFAASGLVVVPTADLLANDVDADGDVLSIVAVGGASPGATVTLLSNGDLELHTAEGFEGDIFFTYTIGDGRGGFATARVDVGIIPNFAPDAAGPIAPEQAAQGTPWSYTLAPDFFTDADGDAIRLSATLAGGAPLPVWLAFDAATRTLTGTPPSGSAGTLSIDLVATDGLSETRAALILTVTGDNSAPLAGADALSTQQYVPVAISVAALLANDSDADNDALVIESVGGAVNGSVARIGDEIVFTPAAGFVGAASFTYVVADGKGGTALATVAVDVAAPAAGATITGTNEANTLAGTAGNDIIIGLSGDDTLAGGHGDDEFRVAGYDGQDTYDGGYGFDVIRGGAGNDTIGLAAGTASLSGIEAIDGGAGYDVIRLTIAGDALDLSGIALSSIEEIRGLGGNDVITGTGLADRINGGGGNDVLDGGDGDDEFLVAGGGGFDDFIGGAGVDRVLGGAGNDFIGLARGSLSLDGIEIIDGGDGYDVLRLAAGDDILDLGALGVTGIEEVRGGAGADHIIGTGGADVIRGDGGDDLLEGGDGDDTFLVIGSNGYDVIHGGAGTDRVLGGEGDDILRFADVAGNLSGVEVIDGGAGLNRIILGSGDDDLDLSAIAVSGIAEINAGAGNDRLVGSASNDILRGGGGLDTFVFRPGFGNDVIADFQRGTAAVPLYDVIDVSELPFADFADLLAHAAQDGLDTLITLDGANSIRLSNIAVNTLSADDFRFV